MPRLTMPLKRQKRQLRIQQNNMGEFLSEINWTPLWISMKTGVVATIIAFFLGVFCARKIMKLKPGARAIMDGILTMPLVLPPTVAGFCLLLLFSLKRPFGKFLLQNFDIKVVQTWTGCVIAASVIAFPLMYRNARAAFEQVDVNLIYAGRTLGMSESRIFWKVIMPCWLLPVQSENTALPPCLPATFLEKQGQFQLPSLQRQQLETLIWLAFGLW